MIRYLRYQNCKVRNRNADSFDWIYDLDFDRGRNRIFIMDSSFTFSNFRF